MLDFLPERFTYNQRVSLLFLGTAAIAGVLAAVLGFLTGELVGVTLGYLTAGLLVMAVVHSWRSPRHFALLAIASVAAFFVFAVLHNLAYAAAELTRMYAVVSGFFSFLDVVFFLVAVLVAPAAAGIGLVSTAVTWARQRSAKSQP